MCVCTRKRISLYGLVLFSQRCIRFEHAMCFKQQHPYNLHAQRRKKWNEITEKKRIESFKVFCMHRSTLDCTVLCCAVAYCIVFQYNKLRCYASANEGYRESQLLDLWMSSGKRLGHFAIAFRSMRSERSRKTRAHNKSTDRCVPVVFSLWFTMDNKSIGLPAVGYPCTYAICVVKLIE